MSVKSSPHHQLHDETEQKNSKERFLVLHNDDYHTFDYVIKALMEICEHDFLQAEQCTQLVHFKGKCDVKKGTYAYLKPMKNALLQTELKATID
jgi:ATP-dependent Clp protease adaptor protein ClpS